MEIGGVFAVGLAPADLPASVSSNEPGGRVVLMFGWDVGPPGVWRSQMDAGAEVGPLRVVAPLAGLERLADLREGPFERELVLRDGQAVRARWTLVL